STRISAPASRGARARLSGRHFARSGVIEPTRRAARVRPHSEEKMTLGRYGLILGLLSAGACNQLEQAAPSERAGQSAQPITSGTAPIINVRNSPYNATGNGTTDDTCAIQTAINDAELMATSSPNAGAAVYLPPGKYAISAAACPGNPYGFLTIKKS